MTSRAASDGFTLLELLVAMTLAALLSVVLFGGLHFGRKAWETAQSATSGINDVRRLQMFLAEELSRAYPARSGDRTLSHVDFAGDAHTLHFLAPDPTTDGGWVYVVVADDGNGISVGVTPELAIEPSSDARTVSGSLGLSYYGVEKGDQTPSWHAQWHDEPRLPTLVRVSVTGRHRLRSSIDIALRVNAPADCVFNPLTRDCQER